MGIVKDIVAFKGNENGIAVVIDDAADYDDIKKVLADKAENIKDIFDEDFAEIAFKGKPLMSDEEQELLGIISEKTGLNVSLIDDEIIKQRKAEEDEIRKAALERAAERRAAEMKADEEAEKQQQKIMDLINDGKSITKFYNGSMRSGVEIEHNGSVVVLGDVNPGAEIKAEGNVIVLGRLKGRVHAGCKGDKSVFVAALYLRPTQLIIGDIITYFKESGKNVKPEFAYVEDERIYFKEL